MQLGLSDLRMSSGGASLGRWRIASRGGGPFGNIGFYEGGGLPPHEHGGLSRGGGYPPNQYVKPPKSSSREGRELAFGHLGVILDTPSSMG